MLPMQISPLKRFTVLLAAAAATTAGLAPRGSGTAPSALMAAETVGASVSADKAILPYLDDDTFIVARLDVEKVDQDELQKLMEKAMDAMFKKLNIPAQAVGQAKAQSMQ